MAIPFDINSAADLVDPAIQQIWLKGSAEHESYYDKYFNVESGVTDYRLKDSSLSGLGYAGRVVENAAVTAASPVQGFDQTYTQVEYGLVLSVTKMMWKFGIKKRDLENIVQELRASCEDLRELRCADRLDNSFSTSYGVNDVSGNYTATITGGDGLAFISAVHTREDGGTAWINRVTDGSSINMDFDYDALKAAHRTAALQLGPNGKPLNVRLDTLVVSRGYAVHNKASEILGAINRGFIPVSADRDGSAVPAFKVIALPWVTTNTLFWWVFDSSFKGRKYGFQYKESQPIELEGPNIVFRTGELQYRASVIFDIGFSDSRGWVGSKNTNAT
jgi:hypothetical protein